VYATTSTWNKTMYDPFVNAIRTQTEAMSAVLGGVNSLKINEFDIAYKQPDDFSEHIALNQQLLLKEEAYFDKVADPSAGSYYIESLTDTISEQSWKYFLNIEKTGGVIPALDRGFIQETIKKSATSHKQDIISGNETYLGVNLFPNNKEDDDIINSVSENSIMEQRATFDIEFLRLKTKHFTKQHKQPLATLLLPEEAEQKNYLNSNNIKKMFQNIGFNVTTDIYNSSSIINLINRKKETKIDVTIYFNDGLINSSILNNSGITIVVSENNKLENHKFNNKNIIYLSEKSDNILEKLISVYKEFNII
jgi:methylmalonyl-CoA mutase cobalamin-binding domain/chain